MSVAIRQEINILDAVLSAAGGASATSNEIVLLDTTKFNNATYYFEIVGDSSVSISFNVTLRRFGTSTDDATCNIPLLTTAFTLVRSSSFTPPAGQTQYVVFIDATAGATKNVKAARIVIIQNGAGISKTETQIELGNQQAFTATTGTALTNPKYWKYVSALWSGSLDVFFEATLKMAGTKATGTVQLQVADGTGDGFVGWADVANAVVTTTSATAIRVRSGFLVSLIANRNYRVTVKTSSSKSAVTIYSAKIIIDNTSWTSVGNPFSLTSSTPAIAGLSATRIAWTDQTTGALRTYNFNGTDWSQVGNSLVIAAGVVNAVASLSSNSVAHLSNTTGLRRYDFNGTDWSQVGNSFSRTATNPVLAGIDSSHIFYHDTSTDQLKLFSFAGSDWSEDAATAITATANRCAVAALSSTRAAFLDVDNSQLRTYDVSGTNFTQVGNSFSIGGSFAAMVSLSSSRVAVIISGQLRTYDFNGTDWSETDASHNIGAGIPAVATLLASRVAFIEDSGNALTTMDLLIADVTKLEAQYLLANKLLAAGTGLQTFLTKWDSTEWSGVTNVYIAATDAANDATSDTEIDTAAGVTVTGSAVTNPDNEGFSSAMTMPANGNLDCKATTNNNDLFAVRILAQVSVNETELIGSPFGHLGQTQMHQLLAQ